MSNQNQWQNASRNPNAPDGAKEIPMARQNAAAQKIETENKNSIQAVPPEFSKEQLKGMLLTLQATERNIEASFGDIAHAEYNVGMFLLQIQNQKLWAAAKDESAAKSFDAYLSSKEYEWRRSRVSLYNYINLAQVPPKTAEKVGLTLASKIQSLRKIDEKAADKATEMLTKAIDDGKTRSEATVIFADFAKKVRDKHNVKRSEGRGKAAKAADKSAREKNEAVASKDPAKIATKAKASVEWAKVTDPAATKSAYTKECMVEVGGLRLLVRSSAQLCYVEVKAGLPANGNGK